MTVKKIMALAAELCGRRDLSDYLNNVSAENLAEQERDARTLLQCYNLTENEIALDYLPLRRTQKFESEGYISLKVDADPEKCGNKLYYDYCQAKKYPPKRQNSE